jgi:2-polyprenyl-3-methyl-5-hydroxy-6-metoxy-1,4-benzoquinol methylase
MSYDAQSESEFKTWNDRMMRVHNNEAFHATSNLLVRRLATWRVAAINRLLNCGAKDRVLDIGCGAGIILAGLNSNLKTGIDLCSRLLERARLRCGAETKLLEGSAEHLAFDAGSFDRVVCSEVIGHVQHPEAVVREAHRVLSPTGTLVITVPASRRIMRIKNLLKRTGLYSTVLGSRNKDVYCPPDNDDWYLHHFDPRTLKQLLETHFSVQEFAAIPTRLFPLHYIYACRPLGLKTQPVSVPEKPLSLTIGLYTPLAPARIESPAHV